MANTFLTPDQIAAEALVLLQSNLVVTRLFSRRYESDLNPGVKVGDTIRIRRRSDGVVDEYNGSTITIRDIVESSTTLVLEKHFDASIRITDKQRTLDLVDFSEQVLAPRMVEMGEKIDTYGLTKLWNLPNTAGVSENVIANPGTAGLLPGQTVANGVADMAKVDKTMNDLKIPLRPRYQIVSTEQKSNLLSVPSFVEVDKAGADDALRMAEVGPLMGISTFLAQNVDTTEHTTGTMESCVTNGALAAGATSVVFDTANGAAVTLKAGDIIEIAGYGNAVVNADVTASASAGTIVIREPLREAVGDGVAITVYDNVAASGGASTFERHGAVFHPDAFAFVSAPLDLPIGAEAAYIPDPATGLSMRAVFDYDRDLKADVLSLDILVGAEMVDGKLGAQVIKNTD
jgi:hypothetical protein